MQVCLLLKYTDSGGFPGGSSGKNLEVHGLDPGGLQSMESQTVGLELATK